MDTLDGKTEGSNLPEPVLRTCQELLRRSDEEVAAFLRGYAQTDEDAPVPSEELLRKFIRGEATDGERDYLTEVFAYSCWRKKLRELLGQLPQSEQGPSQ